MQHVGAAQSGKFPVEHQYSKKVAIICCVKPRNLYLHINNYIQTPMNEAITFRMGRIQYKQIGQQLGASIMTTTTFIGVDRTNVWSKYFPNPSLDVFLVPRCRRQFSCGVAHQGQCQSLWEFESDSFFILFQVAFSS